MNCGGVATGISLLTVRQFNQSELHFFSNFFSPAPGSSPEDLAIVCRATLQSPFINTQNHLAGLIAVILCSSSSVLQLFRDSRLYFYAALAYLDSRPVAGKYAKREPRLSTLQFFPSVEAMIPCATDVLLVPSSSFCLAPVGAPPSLSRVRRSLKTTGLAASRRKCDQPEYRSALKPAGTRWTSEVYECYANPIERSSAVRYTDCSTILLDPVRAPQEDLLRFLPLSIHGFAKFPYLPSTLCREDSITYLLSHGL